MRMIKKATLQACGYGEKSFRSHADGKEKPSCSHADLVKTRGTAVTKMRIPLVEKLL